MKVRRKEIIGVPGGRRGRCPESNFTVISETFAHESSSDNRSHSSVSRRQTRLLFDFTEAKAILAGRMGSQQWPLMDNKQPQAVVGSSGMELAARA